MPRLAGLTLDVRPLAEPVDPESAFLTLFADSADAFWLDGACVEAGRSRFSFLGDGSGPRSERLTYRVGSGQVMITGPNGGERQVAGDIFTVLSERWARRRVATELPFGFAGGYVGYFGYELKADCGAKNRHRAATPDACWLFADRLLVIDHHDDCPYLVALRRESDDPADSHRWFDSVQRRLRAARPVAPPSGSGPVPSLESMLGRDRDRYLADVAECQRRLRAGESYEICLTNMLETAAPQDPLDFYRRLRRVNAAPYAAFLRLGGVIVAGSSPERFLRIEPDGRVESKPIKGTAPRHAARHADQREAIELAASDKARAENLMIVDLLRNDLGRVCRVGSVVVPNFMVVESYTTLHQLVSTIVGQLRPEIDAVDCVRACFPGGSMTGAPKLRTMEIIDELEEQARGVYSGALGYFGAAGTVELSIVIRTAVIAGGRLQVGAGGAIVLDSTPVGEYDEMMLKAAAPLRALGESPATPRAS